MHTTTPLTLAEQRILSLEAENARLTGKCEGLGKSVDMLKESLAASDARLMRALEIVEKADILATHQIKECESCSNPCMAYGLARMYQEARHA